MIAATQAIEELLAKRGDGKTICPSEAARLMAGNDSDWREHMDAVHRAVDDMLAKDAITMSWKGIEKRQRRGPYRIARRRV